MRKMSTSDTMFHEICHIGENVTDVIVVGRKCTNFSVQFGIRKRLYCGKLSATSLGILRKLLLEKLTTESYGIFNFPMRCSVFSWHVLLIRNKQYGAKYVTSQVYYNCHICI